MANKTTAAVFTTTPRIYDHRHCSAVFAYRARATGGPNTANGTLVTKTSAFTGPRIFPGTSSPSTTWNNSCPAAATPLTQFVPTSAPTLRALAPAMFPATPNNEQLMTNQRRPKMSDSRPTSVKPTASPSVHDIATQVMCGDGPREAFISESVVAGSTQPRYPDIWARQVAWEV